MKSLPKIKLSARTIESLNESELEQFKGGSYMCCGSNANTCDSCTVCTPMCMGPEKYTCSCPTAYGAGCTA